MFRVVIVVVIIVIVVVSICISIFFGNLKVVYITFCRGNAGSCTKTRLVTNFSERTNAGRSCGRVMDPAIAKNEIVCGYNSFSY